MVAIIFSPTVARVLIITKNDLVNVGTCEFYKGIDR